ncbi:unnamed protein product [Macrosiphum euphorbiae]|uniref:Uncharacterized protein n=1 Tax=Macrosiphum euphorbiae TaxID=13131 RepID=A0AAV0XMZ1_9HEMI|nr:unnamed protein product [Macrosiphum euphorbiae]
MGRVLCKSAASTLSSTVCKNASSFDVNLRLVRFFTDAPSSWSPLSSSADKASGRTDLPSTTLKISIDCGGNILVTGTGPREAIWQVVMTIGRGKATVNTKFSDHRTAATRLASVKAFQRNTLP